jgi:hypothetical protein
LVPGWPTALTLRGVARGGAPAGIAAGPLVAHVRDLASGEIAFLVGSRRLVVRDPDLAVRIHTAAQSR